MSHFLVYYGHDPALIPALRQCSILVLEPRGWTASQLAELRATGGPKLLGYLSPLAWPGWAGPSKWWWGSSSLDEEWGARWHSLAWWGWRLQVKRLCREVRGCCDGIFIDNLDRLQADPGSVAPLLRTLLDLRRSWPEGYLLGNRGCAHWAQLGPALHGVMLENLADGNFSAADRGWVEEQLQRARQARLDIYALDYNSRCSDQESLRLRRLFPEMMYYRAPDQSLQSLATGPVGVAYPQ